jgi:hypothetical protein
LLVVVLVVLVWNEQLVVVELVVTDVALLVKILVVAYLLKAHYY